MKNQEIYKLINYFLFLLLILSYGLFNYYYFRGWWNSSAGAVLIIFFSYLIWKKDFLRIVGLDLNLKIILKLLVLTTIIIICSLGIMHYIDSELNISIQFSGWKNYYHDIFYILNEEIVLGAIILYSLVNYYKIKAIVTSVGLALVFSFIHFGFYKWFCFERGTLEVTTLLTLFFVGFVRNNLIIQTGHIGYSWALHFGWMVVMLGSKHVHINSNQELAEPEIFNTYLGSWEMVLISGLLAIISLIYWIRNKRVDRITDD